MLSNLLGFYLTCQLLNPLNCGENESDALLPNTYEILEIHEEIVVVEKLLKSEPKPEPESVTPIIVKPLKPINVSSSLDELFRQFGSQFHVDREVLSKIAYCESRFNPQAVNGFYAGLFQFCPSTWVSNRKAMGLDPDLNLRFDPQEAVRTAAFKIGRDGPGAWPVCGR